MTPSTSQLRTPGSLFAACAVAGVVPEISSAALTQVMLHISHQFQAQPSALQVMITVSKLILASFVLTGGRLGDIYGRRKILIVGTCGMAVAAVLCAVSPSMQFLVMARALDGIFSAMVIPLALALLVLSVSEKEQPIAIGYYLCVMSVAGLAVPYLVALLVQVVHWRIIFLMVSGTAALSALFLWRYVSPVQSRISDTKLDLTGSILCAAALSFLLFGLIQSNPLGWKTPLVWESVILGLVMFALFVIWELRVSQPLIDFSLFRNRKFSVAIVAGMVIPFVGAGLSIPLLTYFRLLHGSSPATAALQVMPLALATAITSPFAGRIAQHWTERSMISFGLVIMAVGAFGLSWIRSDSSYGLLALPMVLIGSGYAFAVTSRTAVVMRSVPSEASGAASGINTASSKLGSALGTALVSTFFIAAGRSRYLDLMGTTRLSYEQVRGATLAWRAARNASSLDMLDLPQTLIQTIETHFKEAFAYGLGRTELAACLLLLSCAVLVWFTLERETHPQQVHET